MNKLSDDEEFGSDLEVEDFKEKKSKKKQKEDKKQFDEVPAEKGYSDMDSDEIAEV